MDLYLGKEREFNFNELFFSRTNAKGIIQSGNSVFQRISQYEWDEMLNKPHNIIRHPAMPKGVFHLLWETIRAGDSIAAYVVNQAKHGSYYWVFALVLPVKNGFVSIRLKPSSPIFDIVKQKYAELLSLEKNQKLSPKQSQDVLLEVIQSLNFPNYRQFMTEALTQELEARQKALSADPLKALKQLRDVLRLGLQLQQRCDDIFLAYQKNALVPLNLEVQAARIGAEAAPIAVISAQYDGLARQIQDETKKFVDAGNLVRAKVTECQFNVCNSLLQREMLNYFRNETELTPIDRTLEMNLLEGLSQQALEAARQSLAAIEAEFKKFKTVYEVVLKLTTALEIVSISGKIEAVKLNRSSDELYGLLEALGEFKISLKRSLLEIDDTGKNLMSQTYGMKHDLVNVS